MKVLWFKINGLKKATKDWEIFSLNHIEEILGPVGSGAGVQPGCGFFDLPPTETGDAPLGRRGSIRVGGRIHPAPDEGSVLTITNRLRSHPAQSISAFPPVNPAGGARRRGTTRHSNRRRSRAMDVKKSADHRSRGAGSRRNGSTSCRAWSKSTEAKRWSRSCRRSPMVRACAGAR